MAVLGRLGSAVIFGLFLAATGLHTAFHGDFWARGVYFAALSIVTVLVLTLVMNVARPRVQALWLRTIVIIAIMTPVMALVVFAFDFAFAHVRLGVADLPAYLGASLVISAMIGLLMAFSASRVQTQTAVIASGETPPTPPRFLERLPPRLRGADLWAVSAEDHYLRVHTSKGQDLILLRLSDAIAELEGLEGAQTHRSWWVAKGAIADAKRGDGAAAIHLPDGTQAPVSRPRIKALRERGWI